MRDPRDFSDMLLGEKLTVRRGRKTLIENVDFALSAGELVVLAGPNGAGKSTLLRVLSGEVPPDEGRVILNGRPLQDYREKELAARRAFLAQQTWCSLPFQAMEVVLLGRSVSGRRGSDDMEIARAAMRLAGVEDLAERRIDTMSGGEQQRTHWARTLAQLWDAEEPRCYLLDEPISSLDLSHQHDLLAVARRLARNGAGVVVVLHDLNLSAQYADRIVMMRGGHVVASGTPREVIREELIGQVFSVHAQIAENPSCDAPAVFVRTVEELPLKNS